MQEIKVVGKTVLSNNGCNACAPVPVTMYKLYFSNGVEVPMEDMTVQNLVMAIVLREGYNQELKIQMSEEYVLFSNGEQEIRCEEEYGIVTYKNAQDSIETNDKLKSRYEVFEKVNEIITTIFKLNPVRFIEDND